MPIYEYNCHMCGKRVEVLVLSPGAEATCPICGEPLKDKLISAPFLPRYAERRPLAGHTCCGLEERCGQPPCEDGGTCIR
jgi:putative FmdB family regulatory protein